MHARTAVAYREYQVLLLHTVNTSTVAQFATSAIEIVQTLRQFAAPAKVLLLAKMPDELFVGFDLQVQLLSL